MYHTVHCYQEAGGFHLLIRSVREEDNGTYICQVNTEPPINQVTIYLDILQISRYSVDIQIQCRYLDTNIYIDAEQIQCRYLYLEILLLSSVWLPVSWDNTAAGQTKWWSSAPSCVCVGAANYQLIDIVNSQSFASDIRNFYGININTDLCHNLPFITRLQIYRQYLICWIKESKFCAADSDTVSVVSYSSAITLISLRGLDPIVRNRGGHGAVPGELQRLGGRVLESVGKCLKVCVGNDRMMDCRDQAQAGI